MARPREFDEDEVLDLALATFWEHGYEGTSIDDLVAATGLGRASLYGAFGDKEQIFARALERYCAQAGAALESAEREASARAALRGLFRALAMKASPKSGPRGCFLLTTAVGGDAPAAAREAYAEYTARLERALTALVRRGQRSGEFTRAVEAQSVARMLALLLQGIAAGARAGRSKAHLEAAIEAALELVGPTSPG
ncbi:MAG: TetR/AcrR family transcriptional regulator [Myxococcales bacterium]|nr:TetR/AcrR family transcriptional regulator [Myxococcales bacterium]